MQTNETIVNIARLTVIHLLLIYRHIVTAILKADLNLIIEKHCANFISSLFQRVDLRDFSRVLNFVHGWTLKSGFCAVISF